MFMHLYFHSKAFSYKNIDFLTIRPNVCVVPYKILPRSPHQSESNAKAETFFKVVNVLIQWENVENHRRKYEAGE